jgi:uncharacterized protein involved in exopolysaccharide biosynthesis
MLHRPKVAEMLDAAATARDGLHAFRDQLREQLERHRAAAAAVPAQATSDDPEVPSADVQVQEVAAEEAQAVSDVLASGTTYGATTAQHWDAEEEPLKAAVREVTGLVRECLELHRQVDDARRSAAERRAQAGVSVAT